jgi:hypothetical protein
MIVRFDEMLYELKKDAKEIIVEAEFHLPYEKGLSRGVIEVFSIHENRIEFIIFGDEEKDLKKLEFYKSAIGKIHKIKNVSGRIFPLIKNYYNRKSPFRQHRTGLLALVILKLAGKKTPARLWRSGGHPLRENTIFSLCLLTD